MHTKKKRHRLYYFMCIDARHEELNLYIAPCGMDIFGGYLFTFEKIRASKRRRSAENISTILPMGCNNS